MINKIDLPAARTDFAKEQIESVLAIPADDALPISAKSGMGVDEVLEAIVRRVPAPKGSADAPLRALIFDSWFDSYRGAVVLVRVMEGRITPNMKIRLCANNEMYEVETLGVLTPKPVALENWPRATWGLSSPTSSAWPTRGWATRSCEVGRPAPPLPGFEAIKPMVFAGLFPVNASDYELLRDALGKLQLNDAAFFYEPENSVALGFGFRCGFLGLLHMEIVQERLEREFNIELITTAPSVAFRITTIDRRRAGSGQSHQISAAQLDSENRRADSDRDDHHLGGIGRRRVAAVRRKARSAEEVRIFVADAHHADLRDCR